MLLDEPFGALDPVTRDSLQTEFKAIQRELGLTAVLGTMAVQPDAGPEVTRNWIFLLLMLVLTGLLAAAMIRRPLPWTRAEVILAVTMPLVAGVARAVRGRTDLVYMLSPQPGNAGYGGANSAADYGYLTGDIMNNSGHLRVTVAGSQATVDYVRAFAPEDETDERVNGEVADATKFTGLVDCYEGRPTNADIVRNHGGTITVDLGDRY